jgi:hypothetical protein
MEPLIDFSWRAQLLRSRRSRADDIRDYSDHEKLMRYQRAIDLFTPNR